MTAATPSCEPTSPGATSPRAALLLAGSPREILARIVPGDPLGLRPLLATALRKRALLFDADRAFLRVVAECAREAHRGHGRPARGAWLERCVDRALDGLLAEQRDGFDEGQAPDATSVFALIAGPLGLDPAALARGCRAFHGCSAEEREAFFLLVLEHRDLADASSALGTSAPACARAARRALDVFLRAPAPSMIHPQPEM